MFLLIDKDKDNERSSSLLAGLHALDLEYKCVNSVANVTESDLDVAYGILMSDEVTEPELLPWLNAAPVPLLGVGQAAHAIIEAYNGKVQQLDTSTVDTSELDVDNQCVLFDFLPKTIAIEVSNLHFISNVPEEFLITARSKKGHPVAAQHKTREIFTLFVNPNNIKEAARVVDNFVRYAGTYSGAI